MLPLDGGGGMMTGGSSVVVTGAHVLCGPGRRGPRQQRAARGARRKRSRRRARHRTRSYPYLLGRSDGLALGDAEEMRASTVEAGLAEEDHRRPQEEVRHHEVDE